MFENAPQKQALPIEECEAVLRRAPLACWRCWGTGGYPYTVPLSYVYDGEKIFFHCAKTGHKLDAIRRKAGFLSASWTRTRVPAEYHLLPGSSPFGRARALSDVSEKRKSSRKVGGKVSAGAGAGAGA